MTAMHRLAAALATALAAVLVGTVLLASPALADPSDADLEQLRRRVVELRRELVMRDVEIDRLAQELAELRSRVEGCGSATPKAPTTIDDEVEITGLVRVEEFELEEPNPVPVPVRMSGSEPESGGEELYDQGYALFHQQKYPEAERAFQLFLSRFGTSDLADNALFWIGESRWARGDFSVALESYTATVEQFPDGNKVPDSLLKAGRCLEALGQAARAARTYEELVLRFAGSAAAITAKERLDELR